MRTHAAVLTAFVVAGCGDSGRGADARTPETVTTAEFAQLRWIEGRWRGEGGGVDPFYEQYQFVDDSTLRRRDFRDSTFSAPFDSADIVLRGGTVSSEPYVLVELDDDEARFAPTGEALNGFEWEREGDGWKAKLEWDSAGTRRERTYRMRPASAS